MEEKDSALVSFNREKDFVDIDLHQNESNTEPNTHTELLTNQQLLDAVSIVVRTRTLLKRKYQVIVLSILLITVAIAGIAVGSKYGTSDKNELKKTENIKIGKISFDNVSTLSK